MFRALGSEGLQEEIRKANPTGRHCELIKRNPSHCTRCPHNPYNGDEGRDGDLYRAMEQYGHWLDQAEDLQDRHVLGFGPKALSPEEFEVLRLMRHHETAITAKIQGIEIAKLILFAKTKNG